MEKPIFLGILIHLFQNPHVKTCWLLCKPAYLRVHCRLYCRLETWMSITALRCPWQLQYPARRVFTSFGSEPLFRLLDSDAVCTVSSRSAAHGTWYRLIRFLMTCRSCISFARSCYDFWRTRWSIQSRCRRVKRVISLCWIVRRCCGYSEALIACSIQGPSRMASG